MHTVIYRRMAAGFFRIFQDKKAAEGSLMTRYAQGRKCAKVRTKKNYATRYCAGEKLQKITQKKSGADFGKVEKVRAKKEFLYTIHA